MTAAKTKKRKPLKRPPTKAKARKPGHHVHMVGDLGEWRWVLAMLVILIFVILIWGKRIP